MAVMPLLTKLSSSSINLVQFPLGTFSGFIAAVLFFAGQNKNARNRKHVQQIAMRKNLSVPSWYQVLKPQKIAYDH
jgi:hypothetical protein